MKKLLFSILIVLCLCSCSIPFNKEKWLEEPENRNSMVENLMNKVIVEHMTEAEIISLLGEPEQKMNEPTLQYVYYLGRAGFGVDDSLLRLYFDHNSELESHEITHD